MSQSYTRPNSLVDPQVGSCADLCLEQPNSPPQQGRSDANWQIMLESTWSHRQPRNNYPELLRSEQEKPSLAGLPSYSSLPTYRQPCNLYFMETGSGTGEEDYEETKSFGLRDVGLWSIYHSLSACISLSFCEDLLLPHPMPCHVHDLGHVQQSVRTSSVKPTILQLNIFFIETEGFFSNTVIHDVVVISEFGFTVCSLGEIQIQDRVQLQSKKNASSHRLLRQTAEGPKVSCNTLGHQPVNYLYMLIWKLYLQTFSFHKFLKHEEL